jgi:uncharacterized membrane protein YidH (DUF202 family)
MICKLFLRLLISVALKFINTKQELDTPWDESLAMMLVIDAVLSSLASLSRFHRWFRELKNRTKRFYNNVNSKTLKSLEDLVAATAAMHNIIRAGGEEVIPTRQSPSGLGKEYIARGSWIGLGCRWLSS